MRLARLRSIPRLAPHIWLLGLLLGAGLFLRTWDLGTLPAALYPDEVNNGYQAFALARTGAVGDGEPWPLLIPHLDGDFIEPLYVYLVALPLTVLEPTAFVVRLPAAIAGVGLILIVFLLGRELFDAGTALCAAGLVTVSPWLFALSRIAFRANLLAPLLLLSVFFVLRARKQPTTLIAAALCAGLSFYTYSVARVVTPLTFLWVLFWYRVELRELARARTWTVLVALAILIALALPMYTNFFGPGGVRTWNLSIFNPDNPALTGHPLAHFARGFASVLSPVFLYIKGDPNGRHCVPGFGQTFLAGLPFAFAGLVRAVWRRERSPLLVWGLFLIGLLPAALTEQGDNPHALRTILAAPALELATAFGITTLLWTQSARRLRARIAATAFAAVIFALNIFIYFNAYFGHYRTESEYWFEYGHTAAIQAALARRDEFDRILISPRLPHGLLYALFFSRADPRAYRAGTEPRKFEEFTGSVPPGRVLAIQKFFEIEAKDGVWIKGSDGRPYFQLVETGTPAR